MSYIRRPYIARVQAVGPTYDPGFLKAELQRIQAGIPSALVVDVRDFGLQDGSRGTTDDTTNLQKAINQAVTAGAGTATGAVLQLPPGVFSLVGSVNPSVGSNLTLKGAGQGATTLRAVGVESLLTNFPAPDVAPLWSNPQTTFLASNIGVMDLTLDMDYDTNPDNGVLHSPRGTLPYQYPADNYQYAASFSYIDGLWFSNVRFYRSWFNGLEAYSCNRVITDSRCWFDHCGDKMNYLGGYYSGAEIDGFSHGALIDGRATNCGNGFVINAANANRNPDGIHGTRQVTFRGAVFNSTQQGIAVQGHVDGLTIETDIDTVGTFGIAISHPEVLDEGAKGAHNVTITSPIKRYNAVAGAAAAFDITAANLVINGVVITNELPATGTLYGGIIRQLEETVSGVQVKRSGALVTSLAITGSFANANALLSLAEYTRVDNVLLHDTSGTMVAGVVNAATGSTTGSVTVIP